MMHSLSNWLLENNERKKSRIVPMEGILGREGDGEGGGRERWEGVSERERRVEGEKGREASAMRKKTKEWEREVRGEKSVGKVEKHGE